MSEEEQLTEAYLVALSKLCDGDLPKICAALDTALISVLVEAYGGDVEAAAKHLDHARVGIVKLLRAETPTSRTH